jgi:hypothetical protein
MFEQAKRAEFVEVPLCDFSGARTSEHRRDDLLAKSLLGPCHSTQGYTDSLYDFVVVRINPGNDSRGTRLTIVATATFGGVWINEIYQHLELPALFGTRKTDDTSKLFIIRFFALAEAVEVDFKVRES